MKKVTGNDSRSGNDSPPISVNLSICSGPLPAPSAGDLRGTMTVGRFISRAKHRWTVLDPPPLESVRDYWPRSVKQSGPPALHGQVETGLYGPRHRNYRMDKRPHTAHGAAVRCTSQLRTIL